MKKILSIFGALFIILFSVSAQGMMDIYGEKLFKATANRGGRPGLRLRREKQICLRTSSIPVW